MEINNSNYDLNAPEPNDAFREIGYATTPEENKSQIASAKIVQELLAQHAKPIHDITPDEIESQKDK